jgi:hypothetical protein
MDWRFARGGFLEPGAATAWMRMRVQLVEGEEPSPLTRVLVAAAGGSAVARRACWSPGDSAASVS